MRRMLAALVATIAGLVTLLSFKTTSATSPPASVALPDTPRDTAAAPPTTPATSSPTPTRTPTPASAPSPTPSTKTSAAAKTITGSTVEVSEGRRTFGDVQVQITLANGRITKAVAVDYPNGDPRSSEISRYSLPILSREILAAQGTNIDVVSGATYTSDAYAQSVQAALDSAKS